MYAVDMARCNKRLCHCLSPGSWELSLCESQEDEVQNHPCRTRNRNLSHLLCSAAQMRNWFLKVQLEKSAVGWGQH